MSSDAHRNAGGASFSPGFQGAGLGDGLGCFYVVQFSEPSWAGLCKDKSSSPLVTLKSHY